MIGHVYKGDQLTPFTFRHRRDRHPAENYIYALDITSRVIKVGFTSSPQDRITTHILTARSFGVAVEQVWVSPPHLGARSNEAEILRECRARATYNLGPEAFRGVPFAALLAALQHLDYRRLDEEPLVKLSDDPRFLYRLEDVSRVTGWTVTGLLEGCREGRYGHCRLHPTKAHMWRMSREHIEALPDPASLFDRSVLAPT